METQALTAERPITTKTTLAEAMQTLEALCRVKPATSRILEINPELAEAILTQRNVANRPMKPGKIREYAEALRSGQWGLTGDTIKFGSDGTLKDGQNRLAAVLKANGPALVTHAVFGIEPSLFTQMDIGKNRTPADIFNIAGLQYAAQAAACVRWLLILKSDHPGNRGAHFTNEELLDAYRTRFEPMDIDRSVKVAIEVKKGTGAPVGAVAALHYLFAEEDGADMATRFMLDWANGNGKRSDPQKVLQKRLDDLMLQTNNRIHESVRNAMIVQAYIAYRTGAKLKPSDLAYEPGDTFPVWKSKPAAKRSQRARTSREMDNGGATAH